MTREGFVFVTLDGVERLVAPLPSDFGMKALGLSELPQAWVPPFLVVSPTLASSLGNSGDPGRSSLVSKFDEEIETALAMAGLEDCSDFMLRSNAAAETLSERGRYISEPSPRATLTLNIRKLLATLNQLAGAEPIGLIVQRRIDSRLRGHLSNARRVAEEYRDAQVEIEDPAGYIHEGRLTHRAWRRGRNFNVDALACRREDELRDALREPLAWSVSKEQRTLFEWVWDGAFVYIVQADSAEENIPGASPDVAGRPSEAPQLDTTKLSAFQPIQVPLPNATGKLRKHSTYATAGFWQPTFFLLSDQKILGEIADGKTPPIVLADLEYLTKQSLVLRTSSEVAEDQLLPRSNQLNNPTAANEWMADALQSLLTERLSLAGLSIVGHHYIPARGAAFTSASGDKLEVSGEALWGMPEGLYYYPFDTFSVITTGSDPKASSDRDIAGFAVTKQKRWKSHFVAPDASGTFVCHRLSIPWDWKPTIDDDDVLRRMAIYTRRLAQEESRSVTVMWFLCCGSTKDSIDPVPWYHESTRVQSTESTFRRNTRDTILHISTESDLRLLEERAQEVNATSEQLVIELTPTEDHAIRSESFATRVGNAARQLNAIVILNGASLSHIFYILGRTEARVVVRNASDYVSREQHFGKLVRDKIPESVAAGGEVARVAQLTREESVAALKIKLVEEAFEARDASLESLAEELADVYEVLESLARQAAIPISTIENLKVNKRRKRGGFDEGRLLVSTSTDSPGQDDERDLLPLSSGKEAQGAVLSAGAPALERTSRGATDLRSHEGFTELVENARISLSQREWRIEGIRTLGQLPKPTAAVLEWSIEALRTGSSLSLRLKIRIGETQLVLPFTPVNPDA